MSRNNPINSQDRPAPFANDPTGYWGKVLKANKERGLHRILPKGTLIQSDVMAKARLLQAQIGWSPVFIMWENLQLVASISDGQFSLLLESGGTTNQGTITLTVNKLEFDTNYPAQQDSIMLKAGGQWLAFVVTDVDGYNDDNNPALTLTLQRENEYDS